MPKRKPLDKRMGLKMESTVYSALIQESRRQDRSLNNLTVRLLKIALSLEGYEFPEYEKWKKIGEDLKG